MQVDLPYTRSIRSKPLIILQIYVGDSESGATSFAKETFHYKKPVEDAEEHASRPSTKDEEIVPPFQKDPVAFLRGRFQSFIDVAVSDPVGAFKQFPQTGAVIGGVLATLIGMIGFCE